MWLAENESGRRRLVVIGIFPPGPKTALARIWLFCKITYCGSILTLPPPPVPSLTDALIVLSVSCTVPLGFVVILIAPPLDWLASVVTELFVMASFAGVDMNIAGVPWPVLLAEMLAPLVNVTDRR